MANVNVPSNPTQQPGRQAGAHPTQGNEREPGTPQQPDHGSTKDQEEPNGRASKGTAKG
jgi:hypothetical protein